MSCAELTPTPETDLPAGWPAGVRRLVVAETGSTMDLAREIAFACEAPTWVLAHRQTAGRGRQGRAWAMPPGNLAASLVFDPFAGPIQAAQRSFTTALALRDVLLALGVAPGEIGLKWPNDVLLRGRKLAGILLESLPNGDRVGRLIIGIGVNLAAAPPPDGNPFAPIALAELAPQVPAPETVLTALAAAVAHWEARLSGEGFAPIRAAWLASAARLGEEITVTTAQGRQQGRFETVDELGLLVLGTPSGPQRFASAEITF